MNGFSYCLLLLFSSTRNKSATTILTGFMYVSGMKSIVKIFINNQHERLAKTLFLCCFVSWSHLKFLFVLFFYCSYVIVYSAGIFNSHRSQLDIKKHHYVLSVVNIMFAPAFPFQHKSYEPTAELILIMKNKIAKNIANCLRRYL